MSNKKKIDIKAILAQAKPAERIVSVCLRGDLYGEVERLDRQLRLLDVDVDRLVGNPEAVALARRIEELRALMEANTVELVLRALPRRPHEDDKRTDIRTLEAMHPPREGNKLDQTNGVNVDEFTEALLKASTVSPELDDADWSTLLARINDGQYEQLAAAAWAVNKGDVNIPFSFASSKTLRLVSV